jgi:hypothetical protein
MPGLVHRALDRMTGGEYSALLEFREDTARLLEDVLPEAHKGRGLTLQQKFSTFTSAMDHRVTSALSVIYTTVRDHRSELIKAVDDVKSFWLACVIIDQIAEDALSPDVATEEVISVKSKKPEIQKRMDELDERFGFDRLINDIKRDLLSYGEYTLSTKVDGPGGESEEGGEEETEEGDPSTVDTRHKDRMMTDPAGNQVGTNGKPVKPQAKTNGKGGPKGILEINDDVDQRDVIAITTSGEITGYLTLEREVGSLGRVGGIKKAAIVPPHRFINFSLNDAKIRVNLREDPILKTIGDTEVRKKIPRFVRIGRSTLYPILSKIKELQLLEALVPATKLQKLASGTIIGMRVSTGYDVKKGFEAAKEAEGLLNKKVGIDTRTNLINVENIMSTVGAIKLVPLFGDKGELTKFDYKPDEPDDLLQSVEDIRKVILSAVGIPYEVIFGSDNAESKGELLKRYARYLRRLKTVQTAVANGVRQIVEIHLVNTGTEFSPSDDIQIEFKNKLIQVDLLDELEFLDTTVGMLGNVLTFLGIQEELMSKVTNKKELLLFLQSKLRVLGMEKVIDPKKADDLEDAEDKADDALVAGGAPPPEEEPPPEGEPEAEPAPATPAAQPPAES